MKDKVAREQIQAVKEEQIELRKELQQATTLYGCVPLKDVVLDQKKVIALLLAHLGLTVEAVDATPATIILVPRKRGTK